jgi:diacylglycerol kinase family enzyme
MPVLVLINAMAGTALRSGRPDLTDLIRNGLRDRGVTAEVRLAPGSEITGLAQAFVRDIGESVDRKQSLLVVGGGDGTVGSVASVLAGSDVALGILPLGTLNHFAKDLGLPTELNAAMDVIASGEVRTVDVAEVNGRIFVNNSSIGLYPFLVARREAEQRRWGLSKLGAMGRALLAALRISFWQTVTISAGERRELQTPCVFVGNNFYDLAALGRRADVSAGELCVYVVKPQTRLGLLLLPWKIIFELTDPARDVELFRLGSLEIRSRHRQMRVAADGEVLSLPTPLRYSIRPAFLHVVVPAARQAAPANA